ncbi:hypothetical protein [Nocardiopsis sp. NPDC006938]|uniref:hypothetical protein n=1 Tax=Nocardiopsis sp. NPDC006938 TaxID=3364337 RepID=UPI0036B1B005
MREIEVKYRVGLGRCGFERGLVCAAVEWGAAASELRSIVVGTAVWGLVEDVFDQVRPGP